MLRQFPRTDTGLDELVDGWGFVDQVGHPSVPVYSISKMKSPSAIFLEAGCSPAGLNLRSVVFTLLVVDPSCPD